MWTIFLFLLGALGYLLGLKLDNLLLMELTRWLPHAVLIFVVSREIRAATGVVDDGRIQYTKRIRVGLVFCMAGDFILRLPIKGAFLTGLVLFLVGHAWFIAAFQVPVQGRPREWGWKLLAGFAAYGIAMYAALFPKLGGMTVPVLAY
ncbi:MAG: lysoplasmalogenase family protein, partial [Bdellovibrionota bacterium]